MLYQELELERLNAFTEILRGSSKEIIGKDRYKEGVRSKTCAQIYQEFSNLSNEDLKQFIEYIKDEKILEKVPLINFLIMGFLEFNSELPEEKSNIEKRIKVLSLLISDKTQMLNMRLYPIGPSPIRLAIANKSLSMVKFLLEKEQDLNKALEYTIGLAQIEKDIDKASVRVTNLIEILQFLAQRTEYSKLNHETLNLVRDFLLTIIINSTLNS